MAYFWTATKRRSRDVSWSIIAPPFITEDGAHPEGEDLACRSAVEPSVFRSVACAVASSSSGTVNWGSVNIIMYTCLGLSRRSFPQVLLHTAFKRRVSSDNAGPSVDLGDMIVFTAPACFHLHRLASSERIRWTNSRRSVTRNRERPSATTTNRSGAAISVQLVGIDARRCSRS